MDKLEPDCINFPALVKKVNEIITFLRKRNGAFAPPTQAEVEAYAREYGAEHPGVDGNMDGARFCDFYAKKGWMVGKSKMKDWRAAVRSCARDGWAKRLPNDRALDAGKLRRKEYDRTIEQRTRKDYSDWLNDPATTVEQIAAKCKAYPPLLMLALELREDFRN